MKLNLKEAEQIELTAGRQEWFEDPVLQNYIFFQESRNCNGDSDALTNFQKYYEVYERDHLVGDIKIFYETEEDVVQKRGQLLMVIGDRNKGIGTNALNLLLDRIKCSYDSVYCHILRSNIASLKILKRNGFEIEKFDGDTLRLTKSLH